MTEECPFADASAEMLRLADALPAEQAGPLLRCLAVLEREHLALMRADHRRRERALERRLAIAEDRVPLAWSHALPPGGMTCPPP